MPIPPDILELAEYGGKGGRVLRSGVKRRYGRDAGIPAIPHHFQCGGGCIGEALVYSDGGERGRA